MKSFSKKARNSFENKFWKATSEFAILALIFLGFLIVLSAVEVWMGISRHSVDEGFFSLWSWSILEDLKFLFAYLLPVYLVYVGFYLLISKIITGAFKAFIILFFAMELMLVFYFNTTLLMLGSDLFGYSLQEITQTVGASGSIKLIPILVFIGFTVVLGFSLFKLPRKLKPGRWVALAFPIISLVFLISGISEINDSSELSTDFARNLVKNKSDYFYAAAYEHFNPELYEPDIYSESYLGDFINQFAQAEPVDYVEEGEFPFLRRELNRDVLSPFFEKGEKAPNIVIITVEGLGRAFSNKGAYLGNFTPFLDSLSRKSLYWPNFLSNGGRTFAVLPSLLGSLPFADNGFMEMQAEMPQQMSLLNLLKNNSYETSFYYGGNSEFDKMETYLRMNNVDHILDEDDFPAGYKKIPASATGFTWGYGDKELFRYYFKSKQETSSKPGLDFLLTVSMHSPFIIDETEKYNQKFEEKLEAFGFSEEKKKDYRNYKKQYSSILFADDALKNFIHAYSKKEEFENTIFIITGDHRIPEIPMASKLDRYHVPMIIYSPLLKRTGEFEAVSSHFDLAPSLVSFLKNNYGLKAPQINSFVGRGLDTTRSFQNINNIPLKQTKTELRDFVMGEYHLNGEDLFRINRDFRETMVKDEVKKEELKSAFNQFKRKNSDIIRGKKLIPDSIARKYLK
ncbi:hypothetical protein GCM10023115_41020 [Pontixanthobacter gangjinensis]|uniref:Sulfatase-like hydrolase/transferase n=1 Tax=Christiangramia aestuarii TaxID=1028746 RepID=A0A7K1LRU3_9FLAO|nr:alkaline phosphatase family protein [Christiangramia aestuarii]MUP43513.1 sulfatase-like hydrolase/transferase [Christiangramia aestuarii]